MKRSIAHLAVLCIISLLVFSCKKEAVTPQLPQSVVRTSAIGSGGTLDGSLKDADIAADARAEIIQNLSNVFPPRRCRPGDHFEIQFDNTNQWASFTYYPQGLDYYALTRSSDGAIQVEEKHRATSKVASTAQGTIRTSLWESMMTQKIDPELVVDFADIFASQFDFLTETQAGDTFKVAWEKQVTDDGRTVDRRILGAQYTSRGETYTALLYTNAKGQSDYFSPEGKSLRSFFLRAPLQYRRISSFFTARRYHPVLKRVRPHLGIDYAAPTGTPVSSIGEGVVTYAGRKGGFGNFVSIRHPNGYASFYGHLSRYGKGIRPGVRVHQGQVIGFVGSTGLSTGPHLDFRVSCNGKFINYLKLKFPSALTISGTDKETFTQAKRAIFTQLAEIR